MAIAKKTSSGRLYLSEMDSKRQRVETTNATELVSGGLFSIGDHVRLINLPAHPGLEGLIATVVGVDPNDPLRLHVRLHKNDVVKRVINFLK
jgi:hypothetical protein